MILKGSYDKAEAVPQEFKDSFTEIEGKYVLTGSIETKDTTDYKELHKLKQSSFDDMHELKEQLKAESEAKTDLQRKLEVTELKLKDGADLDITQELVDKRVAAEVAEYKSIHDADQELIKGFKNTIHGNEKNEFINGFKSEFSESVGKEVSLIGGTLFERQADNSYLTVENKILGIEAGLNKEQAVAKLSVSMPNWMKQNTGGQGTGAQGTGAKDDRAKFNELLKKQQSGETLNRQEAVELSTIANQLKNEE